MDRPILLNLHLSCYYEFTFFETRNPKQLATGKQETRNILESTSLTMSLYYESAPFVLGQSGHGEKETGSLKSRVFGLKTLKSSPTQIYALVAEASKWSFVLKEVIENSQLLVLERKVY